VTLDAAGPAAATRVAVIGVGNPYRRDDGVGRAVVTELAQNRLPGVSVAVLDGDPTQLLDAWEGMDVAVIVDAVRREPSCPGRIHRLVDPSGLHHQSDAGSTHGLGVTDAIRLATALGRAPVRVVVYAVEAADVGFGTGLTAAVAAAVPEVVAAVLAELRTIERSGTQPTDGE